MTSLDWVIIAIYMAGLIGLSIFLGRGQEGEDDYYVGGRNLPWWAVGISTMATQASVISFISIPAFVAVKPGGGLTWLQYELAVPLAMIFVMVLLVPFFRQLELISVYEYLEMRFSRRVRLLLSATFLLSRGLGTGVGVFATALVLATVTGLPVWALILLVGVTTIIYDTIGGMKAVVWSDVVQMVILVAGVGVSIYYAVDLAGGWSAAFEAFPKERWRGLDTGLGLVSDPETMGQPMWAYLIGGFFLYASYYGVDQSQAQRELSAPTTADTKKSLVFNGLARFPMTCLYLVLGVAVGAAFMHSQPLQDAVANRGVDNLVPAFVVEILPSGIRAVIIAAMLAAAMSSLDSALNSLSAATLKDFIHGDREVEQKVLLRWSKITTVVWGLIITGFGLLFAWQASPHSPVIVVINKVGAAFYGPILATFVVGVLSSRATARGVVVGLFAGLAVNLFLWLGPDLFDGFVHIHFMWWNATGFVVAAAVALLMSPAMEADAEPNAYVLRVSDLGARERPWLKTYGLLVLMFVAIVGVGIWTTVAAAG